MSIDYLLFLKTDDPIADTMRLLERIDGVELRTKDQLHVMGLVSTNCKELDEMHREIMLDDFGEYGLDVNWLISGTLDKELDSLDLIERLFRCAAEIVNEHPDRPLSFMCNGDSFYVHNSSKNLTVSPIYLKDIPALSTIFKKPFVVDEMAY